MVLTEAMASRLNAIRNFAAYVASPKLSASPFLGRTPTIQTRSVAIWLGSHCCSIKASAGEWQVIFQVVYVGG